MYPKDEDPFYVLAFNRTRLELKRAHTPRMRPGFVPFNRTRLELKLGIPKGQHLVTLHPLIEPGWN